MSITNIQNKIPNCQLSIYNSSMADYKAEDFAKWLETAFNESTFKNYSILADAAKLTRATVSALINAREQSLTGKASQPKRETVIKLALALNKDVNEALLLAGYAPTNAGTLPEELQMMDYDGFDADDIKDIAEYIEFKRAKKEK